MNKRVFLLLFFFIIFFSDGEGRWRGNDAVLNHCSSGWLFTKCSETHLFLYSHKISWRSLLIAFLAFQCCSVPSVFTGSSNHHRWMLWLQWISKVPFFGNGPCLEDSTSKTKYMIEYFSHRLYPLVSLRCSCFFEWMEMWLLKKF